MLMYRVNSKIKKYQLDWLIKNLNEFAGINENDNQKNID